MVDIISKQKIKIMIIDDSEDFCNFMKQTLNTVEVFDVVNTFSDPAEALETLTKTKPDVVIFDLILSKMDGIAFLKKAINLTGNTSTKYIAVSTINNNSIIQKVVNAGATYYMIKPIDHDALIERIRMICDIDENNEPQPIPLQAQLEAEDLENQVTAAILKIGIPAHVKGYYYVRSAILMTIESPEAINAVTKIIYPSIAKMYKTSASRVERAIRHAIEVAWDRGDVDTLHSIFGYSISSDRGKPTNSEFIAMISDRLRLKNKKENTIGFRSDVPKLI